MRSQLSWHGRLYRRALRPPWRGERPAARVAHDLMRAHETALLELLLDYLAGKNSVRLFGPKRAKDRAPTLAIALSEPGEQVAAKLAPKGIIAGGGDFYGVRCLETLGINPITASRASVSCTTPRVKRWKN